jgi:hypothetical protein
VDAHLKTIPGVGTLTARRLPGSDLQGLCRHAHRALDLQVLILGAADEIRAHFLERLHVARRQRDADLLVLAHALVPGLLHGGRHCYSRAPGDLRVCRPVLVTRLTV